MAEPQSIPLPVDVPENPVTQAISIIGEGRRRAGMEKIANACGLTSYQAVYKWEGNGMPKTECTGETEYSLQIEILTDGVVSIKRLLDFSFQKRIKPA